MRKLTSAAKRKLVSFGPTRISGTPAVCFLFLLFCGVLFAQSSLPPIRTGALAGLAFLAGIIVGPKLKIWERGPFPCNEPILTINGKVILGRGRR